ncbi:hypothetical protein [Actinomadura gamaensis]|uniref:Uncharacterized protein n=1 Tax=Actinomadura gamaensis TaxID=1763541 RepID=A0ABV9TVH7_9ACTN
MRVEVFALTVDGGRRLRVYDTGKDERTGSPVLFWFHGTPNIGAPPRPLFADAARLGPRRTRRKTRRCSPPPT